MNGQMNGKELIKSLVSSKSSIAAIGIFALCWIATVSPGQVALDDQSVVSIMPKVPVAKQIDWRISLYITIITCLTVTVRGVLEYCRHEKKFETFNILDSNIGAPEMPNIKPLEKPEEVIDG